jgi:hypothetical protein
VNCKHVLTTGKINVGKITRTGQVVGGIAAVGSEITSTGSLVIGKIDSWRLVSKALSNCSLPRHSQCRRRGKSAAWASVGELTANAKAALQQRPAGPAVDAAKVNDDIVA